MAGVIRNLERARDACSVCPKLCRHVCPAAEAERSEQATPTFKQQVARDAASGRRPLTPERAQVLFKCTDCRATVDACRHRIDVATSLRTARAQAVRAGVAPPEVGWLARRFAERGQPYGQDLAQVARGLIPSDPGAADVGFLPHCSAVAHDPREVQAAWALLGRGAFGPEPLSGQPQPSRLGLAEPACCGYPLVALGLDEAFVTHARGVAQALARFERLIAQGPACAHTLAVRYPEFGVTVPRVQTLSEVLQGEVPRYAAQAEALEEVLAVQDPCFLRRLGQGFASRDLCRALTGELPHELGLPGPEPEAELFDRAPHEGPVPEQGLCAGHGGGYPLTHPQAAHACAQRVGQAFAESGADRLVTACPGARRRLAAAEVPVTGLATLLAERMGWLE